MGGSAFLALGILLWEEAAAEELASSAAAAEELAAFGSGGGLGPNMLDKMVAEVSLRPLCVQAGSPTSGVKRKSSSKMMKRVSSSNRGSVQNSSKMS